MQITRLSPNRKERTTEVMKIVDVTIEQSMKVGDYERPKVLEERIKSIDYALTHVNGALNGLVKLQSMWRMQKTRMKTKILSKKDLHRGYVIKELVNTEEDYVKSLAKLNTVVICKSVEKELLTKEEHLEIFSNIETIMKFNNALCEELKKRISSHNESVLSKNKALLQKIKDPALKGKIESVIDKKNFKDHTEQIIFDEKILKIMDFFKLYFVYCNNFNDSRKLLQTMKTAKHKFMQYIEPLEWTDELEKLDLASFLVKPVQRLPKYVLLLKDLLKNTEETHPDYSNISKLFNKFKELNEENNENMSKYLNNLKLAELEKLSKNHLNFTLLDAKRLFLKEEVLSVIINDMPRHITCYFLSDMLIVGELANEGMRFIKYLTFDEKSLMRNNPDTYYFKNLFTLQGREGGVSFMASSLEVKKNVMSFIEKSILNVVRGKVHKKTFLMEPTSGSVGSVMVENHLSDLKVKVAGTVQRGFLAFKYYTLYAANLIRSDGRFIQIYLRYSELVGLEKMIRKKHPEVPLPQLPPKNWLSSRKTKVIEFRKIVVENFLQTIFKSDVLMNEKNVEEVMLTLNIPYQTQRLLFDPEKNKENLLEGLDDDTLEKYGRDSVLVTVLFDRVQDKELKHSTDLVKAISQKKTLMTVDIFMPGGGSVRVAIKQDTLVHDIIKEVAEKLKIVSWYDFQLFVRKSEGEYIRLDENEPVFKSLGINTHRNESPEKGKQGIFQTLFSTFKGALTKELHLEFRKYQFFFQQMDKVDICLDRVKLELLSFQIFHEIFGSKYMIAISDFIKICSLFVYLNKGPFHADPSLTEYIKSFIPKSKYIKKNDKFWHDEVTDKWVEYTQIIEKAIELNQKAKDNFDYSKDNSSDSSSDIVTNGKCLAQLYMLEIIKKNKFFGCNLFPVKPYKKKKRYSEKIDETFAKLPHDIFLGVKIDEILFISVGDKKSCIRDPISIKSVENIETYAQFLLLTVGEFRYRFNTQSSYEIFTLIKFYQRIIGLLEMQMQEDTE